MRLSGALTLIGAAMVGSAGTAGAATSRVLGGGHGHGHHHGHPHGHGHHHGHPHGHGHGKGRRHHHHDHGHGDGRDELYFRVMVPAGVTDKTVHRHGPISIKASCKKVSTGTRSRALGEMSNLIDNIASGSEDSSTEVHLEASLSVHVKPRAEDCKEDVDFTEHVLTSWDGDGMVHDATRESPFHSSVWPSHPGGISVATASGYYVGFDGDRVLSMVGSEGPFFENICGYDESMDEDFEGCVIITTLEVHGVASDDKCFEDDSSSSDNSSSSGDNSSSSGDNSSSSGDE